MPHVFAKMFKQQLRYRVVELCPGARWAPELATPAVLSEAMQKIPHQVLPYEKVRLKILARCK